MRRQYLFGRQRIDIGDVALLAAAELDAERVDQHKPAEPRVRAHRDFERDPAAERGADQERVVESEAVQQVEIEIGDVVHAAEPCRARGRAKPGMARRDDPPAPRQAVEQRPVLRDIVAAMQEQERRPGAGDHRLDRDPAQIDVLHALLLPH